MTFKKYVLKNIDGKSFTITKEMTEGSRLDTKDCTGARLLKSLTPKKYHRRIRWGEFGGCQKGILFESPFKIKSNVNLIKAKKGDIIQLKVV